MSDDPLYLLDTNVLIHAVRESPTWEKIKETCSPLLTLPCPVISDVTVGEILSFAEQQEWQEAKRNKVASLTGYFQRAHISVSGIIEAYAMIDTHSRNRRSGSVKMGKNDLWIAATALFMGATIVTTDKDFNHLVEDGLLDRILIEQVKVWPPVGAVSSSQVASL
jgi:predicted nucleic acid-binding protein